MTPDNQPALPESVASAMKRAFNLGQTYWQQADSDSSSQQRRSDETRAKFDSLLSETVEAIRGAEPDDRSPSYDALLIIAQSVCAALNRAGLDDCDDPGEAIDVMREGYESRLESLRRAEGATTAAADLQKVYDEFGIGEQARTLPILLTNIRNTKRFADYLHAVEREFFMVPGDPDEDFPDDEPEDECLLNSWGSTQSEYIEQFRKALTVIGDGAPVSGWVMVPEDPDETMLHTAFAFTAVDEVTLRRAYMVMVDARPNNGPSAEGATQPLTSQLAAGKPLADIAYGHQSHDWMASKVRMLMRNDLDHEAVCTGARDRIVWLAARVKELEAEGATLGEGRELRSLIYKAMAQIFQLGEPETLAARFKKRQRWHTELIERECVVDIVLETKKAMESIATPTAKRVDSLISDEEILAYMAQGFDKTDSSDYIRETFPDIEPVKRVAAGDLEPDAALLLTEAYDKLSDWPISPDWAASWIERVSALFLSPSDPTIKRSVSEGDAEWRFEVCERLGMSCAAGTKWTPDEVYRHVRYLEEQAAKTPPPTGEAVAWVNGDALDFMLDAAASGLADTCDASNTETEGYHVPLFTHPAAQAADLHVPDAAKVVREHLEALVTEIALIQAALNESINKGISLEARAEQAERERDALREALDIFERCAYPVSTEINPRGHDWCIGWLDQALPIAREALKRNEK